MPETWQITFQDPATNVMEGISDLHHDIMFFIVLISTFALWMIFITVYTYRFNSYLQPYWQFWKKYLVWYNPKVLHSTQTHNYQVGVIRAVVPSLILLIIAVPSFALLFKMNGETSPNLTYKLIGSNQWYWTYEYINKSLEEEERSPAYWEYCYITDPLFKLTDEYTASVYKFFGFEDYGSKFLWPEIYYGDGNRLFDVNLIFPLPEKVNIKVIIGPHFMWHSNDKAVLWGLGFSRYSWCNVKSMTLQVKNGTLWYGHMLNIRRYGKPDLVGATLMDSCTRVFWYRVYRDPPEPKQEVEIHIDFPFEYYPDYYSVWEKLFWMYLLDTLQGLILADVFIWYYYYRLR